jgi:hypothetical protein
LKEKKREKEGKNIEKKVLKSHFHFIAKKDVER